MKRRLRALYRTLDPVALLTEIRAAQAELGTRIGARAGKIAVGLARAPLPTADTATFAKGLGKDVFCGEQRATHRRQHKPYKTRIKMPSILDPHVAAIERWLTTEPHLTALAIVRRLAGIDPETFSDKQHSIVQRMLRAQRRKAAQTVIAKTSVPEAAIVLPGSVDGTTRNGRSAPTKDPPSLRASKQSRQLQSTNATSACLGNIVW